jgi:hypothetical protein
MAESITTPADPEVVKALQGMQRPIPGQSLTNDPENPAPYERAPKFSNVKQAQEFIFEKLIDEENFEPLMNLLETGEANIMEVTQNLLYSGFRAGFWNPDMMLLLAESTAYTVMALAERMGIDYQIDDEDNELQDEEGDMAQRQTNLEQAFSQKAPTSSAAIPKDIQNRIKELPAPSLLDPNKAVPAEDESLLENPNGEQ